MKLKTTLIAALGAVALFGAAKPASAQDLGGFERIAAQLLAERFGFDIGSILNLQDRTDQSIYDLAPYVQLGRQTRRDPYDVYRLRRQGLGWGEVAKRLGMQPGQFNRMRQQGAFDRDEIWGDVIEDRYGIDDRTVVRRRRSGESWNRIFGDVSNRRRSYESRDSRPQWRREDWRDDRDDWREDRGRKNKNKNKNRGNGNGKGKGRGRD